MDLMNDILVIVGLSAFVLYLCHRMRIPIILGFLLTGIITGPHGLGLVDDIAAVKVLAEVGVVLLLFTIGLEISFRDLFRMKKTVFFGGPLQVAVTALAAFAAARHFGLPLNESILIGFLISLSSTAIVMKILQDRAEVDTPHGSAALGILIFQDLIVVPMMLLIPLLAGANGGGAGSFLLFLAKAVLIILLVIAAAKWVVPRLLYAIARTKSRELFLLSVITICLSIAWLTHAAGLSLALGAFLAGLVISESEYSHQALGNILPFKDVFTSFFFVSIGMLLDITFFFARPVSLTMAAFGVMAMKMLVALFAAVAVGLSLRVAILTALSLGQVGEFSFILSETGVQYGLLDGSPNQIFLAVSVISMMATPFAMAAAPALSSFALKLPLPRRIKRGTSHTQEEKKSRNKNHLVIVGFGLNGRNVARAAKSSGIPYVIVDMNPTIVRKERRGGEHIYYGDATHEAILHHVHIEDARAAVVVINDPAATQRITELIRRLNPKIYLVVRTRFLDEMMTLTKIGADEVVPEEFETSVEIFSRVLTKYLVPKEEIERFVSEIRAEGYDMLRSLSREATTCIDLELCLPEMEIKSFRLPDGSPYIGKSLADTEMRKKTGVTLLALRRQNQVLTNPDPETVFQPRDILFVVGNPYKIAEVINFSSAV